jgi:hypothetical protein
MGDAANLLSARQLQLDQLLFVHASQDTSVMDLFVLLSIDA